MSALAKVEWDYIAHIQREDGTTVELAGTSNNWTEANVYQDLLQKATDHDGFLISSSICKRDESSPLALPAPVTSPLVLKKDVEPGWWQDIGEPLHNEDAAKVFEDTSVFGTFTNTYRGASLCTYKETENG